ncbi:alpha/beta hydrolase [uncultured Croceicoccus sp.]|uniref:alpha/beta fold hydrolase n=1 Tax=uncultured Croceicoccus sp. TaxID=1295329 RepID=UPI00260F187A|nr:alpha/beta hydrolase [uncultured Croceicoccus sp.]
MTAPRLLFVHGAAGDARIWNPVIAALPGGWQAEAITLTYFGDAAWPDEGEGFSTALHARELCDHAARMGGDVRIVCWSYAVHVGLQALLDRPELFADAFFYEAGLPHYLSDADEIERFSRDFKSCFGPVGAALKKDGAVAAVRALIGPGFARMAPERQAIYESNAAMMPLLMGGGQAPAKIGPAELARIETPCRVAMGADTRPAFALPSRALADALPDCDLVAVPGAQHFLPETDPARFAGLVEEWAAP